MKIVTTLLLVLCSTYICYAQGDTMILSTRVGTIIDREEMNYFRLFPEAETASQVVCSERKTGALIAATGTDTEGNRVWEMEFPARLLPLIDEYIRNYEIWRFQYRLFDDDEEYHDIRKELEDANIVEEMEYFTAPKTFVVYQNGATLDTLTGVILSFTQNDVLLHSFYERWDFSRIQKVPLSAIHTATIRKHCSFLSGFLVTEFVISALCAYEIFQLSDRYNKERLMFASVFAMCIPSSIVGAITMLFSHEKEINGDAKQGDFMDSLFENRKKMFFYHGFPPDHLSLETP